MIPQLCLLLLVVTSPVTSSQTSPRTPSPGDTNKQNNVAYTVESLQQGSGTTDAPSVTDAPPLPSCWLVADASYKDEVSLYLAGGAKLIVLNITLVGHPPDMLDHVLRNVYRPYQWIRSANRQGRSLLMLEENYSYLSLSTLSIGVENKRVMLRDHPIRCLRGLGPKETMKILRESFLRDFTEPSATSKGSLSLDEHICNTKINENDGYAEFQYECCHINQDGNMACEIMVRDKWIKIILALIVIIKVLIVLYSPIFLPQSLYRVKYVACQYIHHLTGPPLTLKMVVTQDPDQFGEENRHKKIRLSKLKNMEYFKTMVSGWAPDRIYEVRIKDVRLSVKARRLLDMKTVPVTMVKLIYNNLLRCRIRKLEPLRACCNTNILGRFNPGISVIKWHHCMRIFAGFCLMVIVAIPWIIRIVTYFTYESDMMEGRRKAADARGLDVKYPGNIVLYLTPVHGLFVIIYFIIIFDSVVYGVISRAMKEKFKYVTRQCLRDMKERSRIAVLAWLTRLIVLPFKVFGIVGLLLFIPYLFILLIFTIPIVAFYIFPTLNLSIRLIIHLFIFMCPQRVVDKFEQMSNRLTDVKERLKLREVTANESFVKKHDYTTKGLILQLVVVSMCLISFWSITLLLMEIISFFVELLVYTFMGIIVNAGVTLQYVTVLFLLFLYSKSIFSRVHLLYQSYHKVIHGELMSMKREEINEIAKKEALDQENTAFTVEGTVAATQPRDLKPKLKVKDHLPQWDTSGMLVFLDRHDTPFTPEKFFYETINLNYFGCPGPIYSNVCLAVWEFLKIILFLLFVFLVVMAFGDAYHISSTNQLLATVVGGFVPFLFRYIFKSSASVDGFDTTSIQFLTEFHKAINSFRQGWAVFDIVPTAVREWDGYTEDAVDGNGSMSNGTQPDNHNPETSGSPLLGTSKNISNDVPEEDDLIAHSTVMIEDEDPVLDIIVDVSNPKTRSINTLLKKGFERGSVSMLDKSHKPGGSARIYKPSTNERAIDV